MILPTESPEAVLRALDGTLAGYEVRLGVDAVGDTCIWMDNVVPKEQESAILFSPRLPCDERTGLITADVIHRLSRNGSWPVDCRSRHSLRLTNETLTPSSDEERAVTELLHEMVHGLRYNPLSCC